MTPPRRKTRGRIVAAVASALLALAVHGASLSAQAVAIDIPSGTVLRTLTPTVNGRAFGFRNLLPLQVSLVVSTSADFTSIVIDSTFTTNDTVFSVLPSRAFPGETQVWWRLRVRGSNGEAIVSNAVGPKAVPVWLTLLSPNSPAGNSFDIRRPQFFWKSAPVEAPVGPWLYDVEITANGNPVFSASGLRDTTFRPSVDLQANASYRWNVRASLKGGSSVRQESAGSFVISDVIPTVAQLYQNFPNPFPSSSAFATCFWFDVGAPRTRVSLEVRDLRGNLVKTIVPAAGASDVFDAGSYGRGVPGGASNCDNRYVWDGTSADGRTVMAGVYLARFTANNGRPIFRRIVFRGR
jgi:hypothetical protein